jgi:hypothetical protein
MNERLSICEQVDMFALPSIKYMNILKSTVSHYVVGNITIIILI